MSCLTKRSSLNHFPPIALWSGVTATLQPRKRSLGEEKSSARVTLWVTGHQVTRGPGPEPCCVAPGCPPHQAPQPGPGPGGPAPDAHLTFPVSHPQGVEEQEQEKEKEKSKDMRGTGEGEEPKGNKGRGN